MNNADLIAQNTLLKARLKDILGILVDTLGVLGRLTQTPTPAEDIAGLSQYDLATPPTKPGLSKREHWQLQLVELAARLEQIAQDVEPRPTDEKKSEIADALLEVRSRILTLTHESGTL